MRHRLITVEHTVESFILWRGISMGSVPKCVIQELGGSTFQNSVVPAKSMYIDNSIVYLFR